MTEAEIMQEIEDQNMRLAKSNEHNTETENRFVQSIEQQYMLLVGHSMSADVRKILYSLQQFNRLINNDAAIALIVMQLYIVEAVIKKMNMSEKGE